MAAAATILPDRTRRQLLHRTAPATAVTAVVKTTAAGARCPLCERPATRVHSGYTRSVADVPWQGVPFRLRVHVRRFSCDEPTCARVIFAERLPGLVAPHARRTERLDAWLRAVGFALGGEAGPRLLRTLGLAVASPDTLLRQVRRAPAPAMPTPHVVGVDDWGSLRGRRSGAILVDLERHRVLDLRPDREVETFTAWLRTPPGSDVISRDRGGSFAEGARLGAPRAIQIADRFHVRKNLVEAFQQVLGQEQAPVRAAAESGTGAPLLPATRPLTAPERHARLTAQTRRQVRYETVQRSRAAGKTMREIATELRMGQNTIQRLLRLSRAETCPAPAQPLRSAAVVRPF